MRLNVGQKLVGGFLIVALMTLALGLFCLVQMNMIFGNVKEIGGDSLPSVTCADRIALDLANIQRLTLREILASDPAEIRETEGLISQQKADLDQAVAHYRKDLITDESDRKQLEAIEGDYKGYVQVQERIQELSRANHDAEATRQADAKLVPIFDALSKEASGLATLNARNADVSTKRAGVSFQSSLTMSILVLLLVFGVALGLGILISRQIVRNLATVAAAAEGIAVGRLDQQVIMVTRDEFGDMARTFREMIAYLKEVAGVAKALSHGDLTKSVVPKSPDDQFGNAIAQMVDNLRDVVARVRQAADTVGAAAQQIGSSSDELAATTAVQASSAEETSAAMEEMAANIKSVDQSAQLLSDKVGLVRGQSDELAAAVTQTSSSISELAASIQQVAGNVAHANQVSEQASTAADAGEQAVTETINGIQAISETMQAIRATIQVLDDRSGEIGAIIEVIDDIADQTNLLALNAAIEAARAGDAGRGFAVVADEVRKLAERSAQATKEIGDLIKGIQKETSQAVQVTHQGASKVDEGVLLAGRTGDALNRIKGAADQVTTLLNEVAAATDEQARAGSQIVAAAEQMANINQQVSSAVVEMESATHSVAYASAEQRQGADQVVIAVESLSRSSQEAASATEQVSGAADSLKREAENLQDAVGFFTLEAGPTLEVRVGRPLSLPARV